MSNKIHLTTRRDKRTKYVYFGKRNFRVNLCGDGRKGGFWIEQLAKELGKDKFMDDLRDIFELAADRELALFTLYELPEVIGFDIEKQ